MDQIIRITYSLSGGVFDVPLDNFLHHLGLNAHKVTNAQLIEALEEVASSGVQLIDFNEQFSIPDMSREEIEMAVGDIFPKSNLPERIESQLSQAQMQPELRRLKLTWLQRNRMIDLERTLTWEFIEYARGGKYTAFCPKCDRSLAYSEVRVEKHKLYSDPLAWESGTKLVCDKGHNLFIRVEISG